MWVKFKDWFQNALFSISSTILFLSFGIFYVINTGNTGNQISIVIELIPIMVGIILSASTLIWYTIWRRSEFKYISMHVNEKLINFDVSAVILNSLLILLLVALTVVMSKNHFGEDKIIKLGILIGYGVLLLIPQGLHEYFIYKVKIGLCQRKEGHPKKDLSKGNDNQLPQIKNPLIEKRKEQKDPTAGKFYEK